MKITIIGDIHGRTIWKKIVHENMDSEKIIFLGDYHDIYSHEFEEKDTSLIKENSITNLFEIIEMKKLYTDKIVLLLGNHDTHYMYDIPGCSRYDGANQKMLQSIFIKHKELFQYAWQKDNHIFIHGGILQSWFDYWKDKLLIPTGLKEDLSNLSDVINIVGDDRNEGTNAVNDIPRSRGGYSPFGGPTWADYSELITYKGESNGVAGFHQYVGHNKVIGITKTENHAYTSITFLDVLHSTTLPLESLYMNIEI